MSDKTPSGKRATQIVPVVMMLLVVLFVLQLLLVDSSPLKVTLSVVLIAALGATIGALVTLLRRDRDGVTGL